MSVPGIDVSSIQGQVDWQRVAAAGIRFAWCRTTVCVQDKAGVRHVARDSRIRENLAGARAAGIAVGGYAFFTPALDPIMQAEVFCDTLGDVAVGDLRPAIDFEVLHGVPMFVAVQKAQRFVERVEEITGAGCVVYTMSGASGFWPHTIDAGLLVGRPLWVAHYKIDPVNGQQYRLTEPSIPPQWAKWAVWQWAGNKGPRVDGIATDVDRNEAVSLDDITVHSPAAPPVPVEVPQAVDFVATLAEDK